VILIYTIRAEKIQINKKYKITADLLKYIKLEKLTLIILIKIIIQKLYNSKTIINLIFVL
jgi:hypothetical protein